MAQIQGGWTYQTGDSVTADNLNALVGAAQLQAEAITGQPAITSVTGSTQILATNGGSLSKATVNQILTGANLFDKSQPQTLGNNVTFASGADIALSSDSVMSLMAGSQIALSSASQIALSSGSQIALSSGAILTLGQDPVQPLQAATKQYADKSGLVKAWVNINALTSTVTYRAAFNVSSVVETSAGSLRYKVNFATPLQDNSYCVNVTSASQYNAQGSAYGIVATNNTTPYDTVVTTSSVTVSSHADSVGLYYASIFVSVIR